MRCRTGIIGQEPEYLSDPPHSAVAPICDRGRRDQRSRLQPKKLLRKKKNESWAMRLTGQTSPTLRVGGNLYAKSSSLVLSFGQRTRPACWRARLAIANFSCCALPQSTIHVFRKACFGATPKPARETRALPNPIRCAVLFRADPLFRAGSFTDAAAG